jgi:hypothetical protein
MYQANRDARERESGATKNNPIFTGGGLIYDGVIYLEIPEITQRLLLSGIGAGSIDVEPVFLLGQSALGYVMGRCRVRPAAMKPITTSSRASASRLSTALARSPRLPRLSVRLPRSAI